MHATTLIRTALLLLYVRQRRGGLDGGVASCAWVMTSLGSVQLAGIF